MPLTLSPRPPCAHRPGAGPLPVGALPVRKVPVGKLPVGKLPVGKLAVGALVAAAFTGGAPAAHAACIVSETQAPDGIEFDVRMDGTCPDISIIADRAGDLEVWQERDGRRGKVSRDQVVAHPWGTPALGWRITAPLLDGDDHLVARLAWTAAPSEVPHVDVRLDGAAPPLARGGTALSTWTFQLGKHAEWGFTDPKFGRTEKATTWTFGEDGEAGWLDGLRADGAGGWWPGGAGSVVTTSVEAPACAYGEVLLPPGQLTIRSSGPAPLLVVSGDAPVTRQVDDAAVIARVVAPAGGIFRWRVASVSGVGVVPDDVGFVAGTDARFRVVSLHEPSLPLSLRGDRDMDRVLHAAWDAVRAPASGTAGDVRHPRPLNRAWRSGWLTDGERALVLLRFLGQAHIAARWVLTGTNPDPETYVGYDHLLVAAQLPHSNQVIWLDPACASCALGEVLPALSGRLALGGAERAPVLPGSLQLTVALVQSATGEPVVQTTVVATGAGARWLRTRLRGEGWDEVPAERLGDVARAFGAVGAARVVVTGWRDETITVRFDTASAPRPVDLPQFGG